MNRRKFISASLLAAMATTIIKAAEKAADPPSAAAVRKAELEKLMGDNRSYFTGGITWVDMETEEVA